MAQAFDTDTFILEIQSRKAIYNLLSQEYSNRDLKKKQEEEIVELFGRVKYFKQSFWSPFLSQRMNPTLFFVDFLLLSSLLCSATTGASSTSILHDCT